VEHVLKIFFLLTLQKNRNNASAPVMATLKENGQPFPLSHTPFGVQLISQGRHFTALAIRLESTRPFGSTPTCRSDSSRSGALQLDDLCGSAYQIAAKSKALKHPQRPGPDERQHHEATRVVATIETCASRSTDVPVPHTAWEEKKWVRPPIPSERRSLAGAARAFMADG
jgi:hypothetical protein